MDVIVNYGLGNVASIRNMLRYVGHDFMVVSDPDLIARASRIILPGVGAFDYGMKNLKRTGIVDAVSEARNSGSNILGICLGMQLLGSGSEEGVEPGLGFVAMRFVKFRHSAGLAIPHMGWNRVVYREKSPFSREKSLESRYYFVHSYKACVEDERCVSGLTDYGGSFASVVHRDNVIGCQFHPEKSHQFGMEFFRSFLRL